MHREKKYSGVIVPMITPFTSDFSIDERAVAKILESFARQDVTPFILGTTGEGASMSPELKQSLVKSVIGISGDKQTVYAGISGNSYVHSLEEAKLY
ncbi:MAG TPA: dihydrodipicolinate synthase family protein, partial [Bacteroidaceae bacterium]|nr:dihydrodipicolinate synthase family protein [Bacteroidaceae bacterium]